MSDINTMFVWIPRFKYKLFNVDGTISPVGNPNMAGDYLIDVQLEDTSVSKSIGTQNGEWLTHPAFTFGGQELEGFWVGKFETGYHQGSDLATYTKEGAEKNEVAPDKILIKPTINSWRGISVSNLYHTIQGMGTIPTFGLDAGNDPHLMKSMEWGAMAYLTISKYGKAGNTNYSGYEKQVRVNNNSFFLTGCAANVQDDLQKNTCNVYDSAIGVQASTTGNISGIYDAAGGALEQVMGAVLNADGKSVFQDKSGFTQEELDQLYQQGIYLDTYAYRIIEGDCSQEKACLDSYLGDMIRESAPFGKAEYAYNSWYSDNTHMPSADQYGWMNRGGDWHNGSYAGTFGFSSFTGEAMFNYGGRPVIL